MFITLKMLKKQMEKVKIIRIALDNVNVIL